MEIFYIGVFVMAVVATLIHGDDLERIKEERQKRVRELAKELNKYSS